MLLLSSLHSMVLVLLVLMMITWQGQGWRQRLHPDSRGLITSRSWSQSTITSSLHILQMSEGESIPESMPRPNVLVPSKGVAKDSVEKFLMMYTCKLCNGRNAQMVSIVSTASFLSYSLTCKCRCCYRFPKLHINKAWLSQPAGRVVSCI